MNKDLKNIINEISKGSSKGRWLKEGIEEDPIDTGLGNVDVDAELDDSVSLNDIVKEISKSASHGRWSEAEDPLAPEGEEEDPLAGGEDPLGGEEDLFGDTDLGGGMGDDMGMGMDEPIDAEAEAETAESEANAAAATAKQKEAEANADKAEAEADQAEDEKMRAKADAEANDFSGIEIFSRPGTAFLVGQLLDDYQEENKLDSLAQQFVSKLKMDEKGFQQFKAESGALVKLKGFQQLLNSMETILKSSSAEDIDSAVEGGLAEVLKKSLDEHYKHMKLKKIVEGIQHEEQKVLSTEEKREFLALMENYNKLGRLISRDIGIDNIAEQLSGLADNAKSVTLMDEDSSWFDKQTVSRNMNELTRSSKEFSKIATEAHAMEQRMSALYEDMGHILNRYFQIND